MTEFYRQNEYLIMLVLILSEIAIWCWATWVFRKGEVITRAERIIIVVAVASQLLSPVNMVTVLFFSTKFCSLGAMFYCIFVVFKRMIKDRLL